MVTFDSSMAAGAMLAECFAPETADAIGALEVAAAHRLTRMTRRQITRLPPPSVPYSASRIVVVKGAPSDPDHALETAKRVFE